MPVHLVIHGHFYQPPRENPWTGTIERQESAAPFHDWNARIAEECYLPNARARVLDAQGRIQDIVNNYEVLSFNFGPTLLSWAAGAVPDLLRALVAADRASRIRLGHGNAIAQAYNHMILPLAAPRDRRTQIRWGLREFQHRFGRAPEAMWLPETAVDAATLDLLIDAGMPYIILSPAQAARWRPLGDQAWTTAADGEIDPRRPYRWVRRGAAGQPVGNRGIDVCFYHAPLSRGISFQHYLRDADRLAGSIADAGGGMANPLILVATDGESFGHHEKFGEMCLATLFSREAGRRDFRVTNLASYLAAHRPAWEVELHPQSAWSCSHGVGRWCEDCGCSAGGGPGWNQAWRRPLRQGLDRLRDALAAIFREEGAPLLRDPWAARDDYIDLLLDGSQAVRDDFFQRHQAHALSGEERARSLRLLEMQHHAMLMFTSCAWFFADISGIETLQNLRYAARAIDLAVPFAHRDLEALLLEDLGRAQSNLPAHKTGRHLWEREVRPSRVGPEEAVARLLAHGVLAHGVGPQARYRWVLAPGPITQDQDLLLAGVRATSEVTGEALHFAGVCRRDGPFDFLAGVGPWPASGDWAAFVEDAGTAFVPNGPRLAAWSGRHAARLLRLRNFLPDDRQALLGELLARNDAWLAACVSRLSDEALPAAEAMVAAGMPLPVWLKSMLETHWSRRFTEGLATLQGAGTAVAYTSLLDLADRARHLGLTLDRSAASAQFGQTLVARLEAAAKEPDADQWQEFLELLQTGIRLDLGAPEYPLQDRMFALLRDDAPAWLGQIADVRDPRYRAVSAMLAAATRLNVRTEEIRAHLTRLEGPVAEDPAYWP